MDSVVEDSTHRIIDQIRLIKHYYSQIWCQRNHRISAEGEGFAISKLNAIFREIVKLHVAELAALKELDVGEIADLKYSVHLGKSVILSLHGIGQMDQNHRDIIYFISECVTKAYH